MTPPIARAIWNLLQQQEGHDPVQQSLPIPSGRTVPPMLLRMRASKVWIIERIFWSGDNQKLLDQIGGLEQHVLGDGEAEALGGLEVDDEVEATR